jgi:hypothetical protein
MRRCCSIDDMAAAERAQRCTALRGDNLRGGPDAPHKYRREREIG